MNVRSSNAINVFKSNYSEELYAYFIKSKESVVLFVNENLSPKDQALCVSIIEEHYTNDNMGLIKKGFIYCSEEKQK